MNSKSKHAAMFVASRCFCSPLESFYTLLPFIATQDLKATPFQLAILASVKPMSSLLAFQMSASLSGKTCYMRHYLIAANIAGCLLCLTFPWIENCWFYVIAYALFIMTARASYPAWAEILKTDFALAGMAKIFSRGVSINYTMLIVVPFLLSCLMDSYPGMWKRLFFGLACLQLCNSILILQITLKKEYNISRNQHNIIAIAWTLLKKQPAFTRYLSLFFLGGTGLIAMQPVLPLFFKEHLHLSYKDISLAVGVCKSIGFLCTTRLWTRYVQRVNLYHLNLYVNLFSCLFITFILVASFNTCLLFVAYCLYGTMQAGCEMSWNISGPYFARDGESILHSSLNLALVGIRGCICPFLGYLIFSCTNTYTIFTLAFCLTFVSLMYAQKLALNCKKSISWE